MRAMRNPNVSAIQTCNQVLQWMDAHEDALPSTDAQRAEYHLRTRFNRLRRKTVHSPEVRVVLEKIFQQRSRRAARLAMRKRLTSYTTTCKKVLEWMDAHVETLPILLKKPANDVQRGERLLRGRYNYLRRKTNPSPELRAVFEEIERRMSLVFSASTTCKKVLEWMDAHEDALPLQLKEVITHAQRAEYLLRIRYNNLKRKTDHSVEVCALLDKIVQQRSRRAARLAMRKRLSSSTATCKKVLEWMDVHEETLPVLLRKPTTDAQRAELLLRRQYNYLRRKTTPLPDLRVVLDQIESRVSFVLSATTICKKVLEWMYGHKKTLPKEFRKPTTDAQRAEYLLRNQLKYLKRKTDQPPEVLRLLDQIKRLTLHVPILKQCLTVPLWWPSSEGSESCELPVPKRRRLLGKTKVPSFALD
jgi:hypothetical protein